MLKLSEAQWEKLQKHDAQNFVAAVCDQYLATHANPLDRPDRDAVLQRMQGAYDAAATIGFTSGPHIVRLMYLAADAPGIHSDPLVNAYLRKPGGTPEQRLDDMLALMNSKLERTH